MRNAPPGRTVLERARRGDARAFETVVGAYGDLVLNLAWRMVRDRHEAEDLSQEVFMHLHRVLPRYDPRRPFEPWLRRVVRNKLLNLVSGEKRRRRRAVASLSAIQGGEGDRIPDPAAPDGGEAAERRERAARLRAAVRKLTAPHRLILALRYFEGLTYDDLSRELGIPLGTVKNRLFRAREELADLVGDLA